MKIGSYRIEPGEIEAVMAQCQLVSESLVVCSEKEGQKFLVAYVVSQGRIRYRPMSYRASCENGFRLHGSVTISLLERLSEDH